MKYSIIVPVYNVEKYIEKCLSSIKNQSYDDFEVIVVNDGTLDNSQSIINKFVKKDKRFKSFIKENGGLSDARNYGVSKASGDIILFIDGDDYIDNDLLLNVSKEFEKNGDIDVVRFQLRLVDEENKTIEQPRYHVFSCLPSIEAYPILLQNSYVDVAWGYAYRKDFFIQNKFQYAKGRIHEDLGLTHLILVKANYISSIAYVGYNYVQREGSIMTVNNRKQILRKTYDTLYHFDNYISILEKDSSIAPSNREHLTKFLIETIIYKAKFLNKEDLNKYIKEIKKRKIYRLLPSNSKRDKLRRLFVKYALRAYVYKNIK